jgi:hypothetical protein
LGQERDFAEKFWIWITDTCGKAINITLNQNHRYINWTVVHMNIFTLNFFLFYKFSFLIYLINLVVAKGMKPAPGDHESFLKYSKKNNITENQQTSQKNSVQICFEIAYKMKQVIKLKCS